LGAVLLSLYRMRAWDPLIAPRHAQPAASTRAHGASQPGGDGTVRDCVTFKFTAFNFGVQQTMLTATKKWPQPPLRCFSAWGICVCVLPLGSLVLDCVDHRFNRSTIGRHVAAEITFRNSGACLCGTWCSCQGHLDRIPEPFWLWKPFSSVFRLVRAGFCKHGLPSVQANAGEMFLESSSVACVASSGRDQRLGQKLLQAV